MQHTLPWLQGLDVAQVLRGLPRHIAASAPVAFALRVLAALRAADFGAFLRLWGRGTWAQRALMAPRLRLLRVYGMRALAAAYRPGLPATSAARLLSLQPDPLDRARMCGAVGCSSAAQSSHNLDRGGPAGQAKGGRVEPARASESGASEQQSAAGPGADGERSGGSGYSELMAVLAAAAERGSRGAQRALAVARSAAWDGEGAAQGTLVFAGA